MRWRGCAALALAALAAGCAEFDLDMRDVGNGLDTSAAALSAVQDRPAPDARGIITYPSYQVAVARRGDTVRDVAARVGLPAAELARFNGAPESAVLNEGEVLVLPRRAAAAPGAVDVGAVAGAAIDRAEGVGPGDEPQRHKVGPGETAFSIARRYGVPVAALAEWNGLDDDFTVREGQVLLIPPRAPGAQTAAAAPPTPPPGTGSPTPTPPSAAEPLPENEPAQAETAASEAADLPPSPDLGERTAASASGARMVAPVSAPIVREFRPGGNEGIDYGASAGAPVRAAAAGTVAVVTEDTEAARVILVRHDGGISTIYANVKDVQVSAGDRVAQGQAIASVGDAEPPVFRFQVRQGVDAVDPGDYLN
jgi:murein DD-endopeptidase MepM/ murein hydrolase activator NlpD